MTKKPKDDDNNEPIDVSRVRADDEKIEKLSRGEQLEDDDPLTPFLKAWRDDVQP